MALSDPDIMRLTRILVLPACLALTPVLASQASAGTELWRLAAVTLPRPAALATGVTAAFWNPAQRDSASALGLELIQTPEAVGATGVVAALRFPFRRLATIGLVYARMGLGDLVHTTDSPDPDGESIAFYSQNAALTLARGFRHTTVGANLTYRDTRVAGTTISRWTMDVGFAQSIADRVRIAAATRGFRQFGDDPGRDVYAVLEGLIWQGTLWHAAPGTLAARYGITFGHPGGIDHQVGLGLNVGSQLVTDVVVARESSYGNTSWRGAAGFRVAVGRYRLSFARDGGISDLGSTYRVGLEAQLQ